MDPRFDPDADDSLGAERYLRARAHQALIDGFRVDGELDRYFALWLERLAVDDFQFARWFDILQVTAVPVPLDEALRRAPL